MAQANKELMDALDAIAGIPEPDEPTHPGELTITIRNVPEDSPLYREATKTRRCWGGHGLAAPLRATYEEIRELIAADPASALEAMRQAKREGWRLIPPAEHDDT